MVVRTGFGYFLDVTDDPEILKPLSVEETQNILSVEDFDASSLRHSDDPVMQSLEQVLDEPSFLQFLEALRRDRDEAVSVEQSNPPSPYGPGAKGWENGTIEAFIEAAGAWAIDSMRAPAIEVATNPWKRCAQILHAGKVYE